MLATPREVVWFDHQRHVQRQVQVRTGATALAYTAGRLVVGFEQGDVESLALNEPNQGARRIENTEAARVERLVPGPSGIVAVAYDNGTLLLVHPEEGTRLWAKRLHGAPVFIGFQDQLLSATSELGSEVSVDLTVLGASYCSLMQQVWRDATVSWEQGRPALVAPPKDHACFGSHEFASH